MVTSDYRKNLPIRLVYICPDIKQGGNRLVPDCPAPPQRRIIMDSIIEKFKSLTPEHRHDVLELIKSLHTQELLSDEMETNSEK